MEKRAWFASRLETSGLDYCFYISKFVIFHFSLRCVVTVLAVCGRVQLSRYPCPAGLKGEEGQGGTHITARKTVLRS